MLTITLQVATTIMAIDSYNYISALHWLVSETVNGNAAVFGVGYDGDGNRVFKGVQNAAGTQSTVTFYLVDDVNPSGYAQVLEEYQGIWTNNVTRGWARPVALSRAYNYGSALISQQQFDANTLLPSVLSYYGYDGHGSVRFLMDTGGGMTDAYTFDAFGNLLSSTGGTPNNYLYCGQQWDSDLGLYYNRARYLNTGIGRFWTMDGDYGNNRGPLSLHKYLYAGDDPANKKDVTGHDYDAFDLNMALILNYVITSMGRAVPAESTPGLDGPAFVVTSGGLMGGFSVNDYVGNGGQWRDVASPTELGLDKDGVFKVQMVAPYSGYETVGVGQTITLIGANASLLDMINTYLVYYNQPTIGNNQTINEPGLGDDHYSRNEYWFPLYTSGFVTFADVPGPYESGSAGDIQFRTTFYSPEPNSTYSQVSVVWTLHVGSTLSVSQGAQSEK